MRYVPAIKPSEVQEDRNKESNVAGEHLDIMKDYRVPGEKAIQCVSERILFIIERASESRVWVVYVGLAYVQSDKLPSGRRSS